MPRSPTGTHPQRAAKHPNPPRGSKHPRAKLTETQALRIVEAVEERGRPVRDIAWIHGVTYSTVYKLLRCDSWTHI